jgi:hypothetical protein
MKLLLSLVISAMLLFMVEYQPEWPQLFRKAFRANQFMLAGKDSVIATTRHLPSAHPLAELINNNARFFDYLINNSVDIRHIKSLPDKNLTPVLTDSLTQSEKFNSIISDCAGYYLYHRDTLLNGFEPHRKLRIHHSRVASIAVRFYETYYNEYGQMKVKICPLHIKFYDDEEPRYLPLEAFCYQALFKDYVSNRLLLKEYDEVFSEVIKFRMPYKEKDRLEFINIHIWNILSESKNLEKILVKEYNSNRKWLPFIITKKK